VTGIATAGVPACTGAPAEITPAILFAGTGCDELMVGPASVTEPAAADVADFDGAAGGKLVAAAAGCGTEVASATGATLMIVAFGREEAVGELMAAGITGTCEEVTGKVLVAMCCGLEEAGDAVDGAAGDKLVAAAAGCGTEVV